MRSSPEYYGQWFLRTRRPTGHASAHVVTIPASIDATGRTDVSAPMAAFFQSVPDGSTISLAPHGQYRMDQTLDLSGRHNLGIQGNGARFFAVAPGEYDRSNVRIENSSGIIVYNLVVRGANPNAGLADAAYQPAREHQHGFEILSGTNVALVGVTVTDVYGDFVYASKLPNGPWTTGLLIIKSNFARTGRQGIAFTATRNVGIVGNTISDVRAATLDFEPATVDGVENVIVRNNTIGAGRQLFLAANGHGSVNNITVADNRLSSQALQIWAQGASAGQRNGWRITGNTSQDKFGTPSGSVMRISGANGVEITGNVQPFQPNRGMVLANVTNSCNVVVQGDVMPGSVAEARVSGHC